MTPALPVSVTELAAHLTDFVNRAACRGDRFTIARGKKAIARLEPIPAAQTLGELARSFSSLSRLTEEEAAQFGADIENARKELDGSVGDSGYRG